MEFKKVASRHYYFFVFTKGSLFFYKESLAYVAVCKSL
ncbi:hypothetical protein [uncultured Gammaproteobacteria bacterium]|nr:hypothetical protein [uncultured Gammaproteobacteria bacterium]